MKWNGRRAVLYWGAHPSTFAMFSPTVPRAASAQRRTIQHRGGPVPPVLADPGLGLHLDHMDNLKMGPRLAFALMKIGGDLDRHPCHHHAKRRLTRLTCFISPFGIQCLPWAVIAHPSLRQSDRGNCHLDR